ncbi:endonuclease/exonuclease/phosphatase family metal-dependent hydrolase [Flavobacteriaceae bacterium MAR_2010_105]|nr:endonuclease/exonuclease/phosphatase family metal-dependent hydrolase [Flavobacteriaceae bacterium MAR_2010_105]
MKRLLFIIHLFFVMNLSAQELTLMTYNIKLDYPKEGENSWHNRKPMLLGQIHFYQPDVLGVQEVMPDQMKDMDKALTEYDFVGVGRDDGKDEGEYSAIFYKPETLNLIESSTFWLSQTPDQVSMGWDAVCNRVCTYALFENKKTQGRFWVFNTHFDHVGVTAREESAKLIIQKIERLNTDNFPVMLMGDFNMEDDHKSIQFINQFLKDSKDISIQSPFGPSGTFNNFDFHKPVERRIDYIFVSPSVEVNAYAVLSDSKDCKYPSDHLPVLIKASIKH